MFFGMDIDLYDESTNLPAKANTSDLNEELGQVCMSLSDRIRPGLEVIKLEFILKLKIKRNDWLLVDMCAIIVLYFEFETVLKFYYLEARLV